MDMHSGYNQLKSIWQKHSLLITTVVALLAIIISIFMVFAVEGIIERKINDTVLTTKVNVAELEAASKLSIAVRGLKDNRSYLVFTSSVNGIKSSLLGVYSSAGMATSSFKAILSGFERITDLANRKSSETATSTEALIDILRKEK